MDEEEHLIHDSKCVYGSHVPVLEMVGALIRPRRILELGCGIYSTLTFLDRQKFPTVESVICIENDAKWAEAVREKSEGDERLLIHIDKEPFDERIKSMDLSDFDLIMIDNSSSSNMRERTIRLMADIIPPLIPCLIHDLEFGPYRRAAERFDGLLVFESEIVSGSVADAMSCTGIAWHAR